MAAKRRLRVIICPPFEEPELRDVEDSLNAFQRIVEGSIEKVNVRTRRSLAIICNGNGFAEGRPPHCFNLPGTFFWVRILRSRWASVNYKDVLEIARLLGADKAKRGL